MQVLTYQEDAMIRPNELRTGNVLLYNRGSAIEPLWHPKVIDWNDVRSASENTNTFCRYVSPLPLSPEVLGKIPGFSMWNGLWKFEWGKNGVLFLQDYPDGGYALELCRGFSIQTSNLHHLQNLFLDLTGQELDVTKILNK